MKVRRGDLYYADLSPVVGSEQGGVRPVIVVQNDIGNKYSPTIIVAPVTSQMNKAKLPTHVKLKGNKYGLPKNSVALMAVSYTHLDVYKRQELIIAFDKKGLKKLNQDYAPIKKV